MKLKRLLRITTNDRPTRIVCKKGQEALYALYTAPSSGGHVVSLLSDQLSQHTCLDNRWFFFTSFIQMVLQVEHKWFTG